MAWRRRFLTTRQSQRGHVIAALVDFHTALSFFAARSAARYASARKRPRTPYKCILVVVIIIGPGLANVIQPTVASSNAPTTGRVPVVRVRVIWPRVPVVRVPVQNENRKKNRFRFQNENRNKNRLDAAGLLTMGRTTIQVEITTEIRVPPGFWANMRHSRFQNQSASRR
jgi:hypothetical protein